MNCINEINDITNGTFLEYTIDHIKDYDQLDVDIIMSLLNIHDEDKSNINDNILILLNNLFYNKQILSDFEFNKLLYDISNNNLKDINELVEYHKTLVIYMNKI